MTERNTQNNMQFRGHNSTTIACLVVGFAFYWTWNVLCFFSNAYYPIGVDTGVYLPQEMLLRLASLTSLAGTLLLSMNKWVAMRIAGIKGLKAVGLVLFLIALALAFTSIAPDFPLALKGLLWGLQGVCSGILFLFWGVAWSLCDKRLSEKRMLLLVSCIVGITLCFSVMFAPRAFLFIAATVFGIAAIGACLIFFSKKESLSGHNDDLDDKAESSLPPRVAPHLIAIGAFVGFSSGLVMMENGPAIMLYIVVGASALAATTIALVSVKVKQPPKFTSVERFLFLDLTVSLPPLFLLSPPFSSIAMFSVVAFGSVIFFFAQWSMLISWTHKYHGSLFSHYAWGNVTWIGAFAFGWGLQVCLGHVQGLDSSLLIVVICYALMAFLIFASTFSPFGSEQTIRNAEGDSVQIRDGEGMWRSAIRSISAQYDLSPKETEILGYLARGRNAGYIRDQLVVSEHTVKTHMNHIYKKMHINSQQDLISLVDARFKEQKEQRPDVAQSKESSR